MAKSPAFQFYPRDYLTDEKVQVMDLGHEGPYIRALCHCWLEGSIPADPKQLSKLIGKGCTEEIARVVQGCFNQNPTDRLRLVHKRLDLEREKQTLWSQKSSAGGKKSGEIRRKRPKSKGGSRVVEPKPNIASAFASAEETNTPAPTRSRERDPIWDIVAMLGWPDGIPKSQQTRVGKLVADLKSIGAAPEKIMEKFEAMRKEDWGKHAPMESLLKNWSTLRKKAHVPSY